MSSYFSARDMSDPESLEGVDAPDSVRTSIWKQMPHTAPYPTEHTLEWRPRSSEEERAWKTRQRESKGKGLWKHKNKRMNAHTRQAIGNKGRVAANTIFRVAGTARTSMHHCLGKFTSNYRRCWTLRIHPSKSWARQRRAC